MLRNKDVLRIGTMLPHLHFNFAQQPITRQLTLELIFNYSDGDFKRQTK